MIWVLPPPGLQNRARDFSPPYAPFCHQMTENLFALGNTVVVRTLYTQWLGVALPLPSPARAFPKNQRGAADVSGPEVHMIEFAEFEIDESTGEFKLRASPRSDFSLEVAMAELLALRARVAEAEREAQLASLDS